MERKKNLLTHKKSVFSPYYTSAEKYRIGIYLILHLVGVVGFSINSVRPVFISITWLHLLLITVVLFWEKHLLNKRFLAFACVSFSIGLLSEAFGVKSGLLFGDYHYTAVLGYKLLDVPLIIGVLWVGLAYCCNQVAVKIFTKKGWPAALLAALLMALFDYLIEPFAIENSLWVWHSATVPLYNYICWFFVGFIISLIYQNTLEQIPENKTAPFYLLSQAIFFLLLQIINTDMGLF